VLDTVKQNNNNNKIIKVSTQRGEKRKEEVNVEYFFSLADSAEFASQLEPSEEVDKL